MKFATLALALLLAVGSQAVPLQADAPQMLAHARSVADVYMQNLKTSLINAVNEMEDAEMKDRVKVHLDSTFNKIAAARQTLSPMTDTVVQTVMDTTADFRANIEADIEKLKAELRPLEENLREVVQRHIHEYKEKLSPIIAEYQARNQEEMVALRAKVQPVVEELQSRIPVNVEETKAALFPILDAVKSKALVWLTNGKAMAEPYVQEYKDQIEEIITHLRSITPEQMNELRGKLAPLAEETGEKIKKMVDEMSKVLGKA